MFEWSSDNDANSFLVTGNHQYALVNRNLKGPGVMIRLNEWLKNHSNKIADIEISTHSLRLFVAVIYNKPRTPKIKFLKFFDIFLSHVVLNQKLFICCDYNSKFVEQNHYIHEKFNKIASNSFVAVVHEPTRVTHSTYRTSICLDHFIYRNVPNCEMHVLLHQKFSDHYRIQLSWCKKMKLYSFLEILNYAKNLEKIKNYLVELEKVLT